MFDLNWLPSEETKDKQSKMIYVLNFPNSTPGMFMFLIFFSRALFFILLRKKHGLKKNYKKVNHKRSNIIN